MPADQGWEQVAAEAERLCSAATPGPWQRDEFDTVEHGYAIVASDQPLASGAATLGMTAWVGDIGALAYHANAAFIARARTLVPELAAIVRQQAAEVARLRAREQEYGQHKLDCPAHPLYLLHSSSDSDPCLCGFDTDSKAAGEAEG